MADKGEGLGLLLLGGKPAKEGESSAKDDACKAMFDAIKEDEFEAFKDALALYLDERDSEYSDEPDEEDGDDAA